MEYLYGIDLGTTYSSIAECDDEKNIRVISNPNIVADAGSTIVPSVVYFEPDGKPIVGRVAKNQLGSSSTNRVVSLFKREMGEKELKKPTLVGNQSDYLSPIEPSSYLLHGLITSNDERDRLAGNYQETKKAVITIPASFTNTQRMNTKMAAELAGIEVLGLLQEPTAAAISYDIRPGETILVFDLGGGTLDVSIVNCRLVDRKTHYSVLATAGDYNVLNEYVGGIDWDKELKNYVLGVLADYKIGTLEDGAAEDWKLMCAAENCKKDLSHLRSASFWLPNQKSCTVTRAQFQNRCGELLNKCKKVVLTAVNKINQNIRIHRCVMTGGSSEMPMIKDMLRDALSERIGAYYKNESDWLFRVDPANAIVKGAAKYAYDLVHNNAANVEFLDIQDLHPYSYGVPITRERRLYIKNILFSTDSMVIKKDSGFIVDSDEKLDLWLYENTCSEEGFWYDKKNMYVNKGKRNEGSPLVEHPVNSGKPIKKGSKVIYRVSRNVDGIISIEIFCNGRLLDRVDYRLLSDEKKEIILKRIRQMDIEE